MIVSMETDGDNVDFVWINGAHGPFRFNFKFGKTK